MGKFRPMRAVPGFCRGIHAYPWSPGRPAVRLECPSLPWPVSHYPAHLYLALAPPLLRLSVPPHAWPGPTVPPTGPGLCANPLITHAFWSAPPATDRRERAERRVSAYELRRFFDATQGVPRKRRDPRAIAGTQPHTSDIWGVLPGKHCWQLVLATITDRDCSFRLTLRGL